MLHVGFLDSETKQIPKEKMLEFVTNLDKGLELQKDFWVNNSGKNATKETLGSQGYRGVL